jgi:FMN phosphatase YigB (HAD superfamily)
MNWPHELAQSLLDDLFLNQKPALFDDALPFLERLLERRERILVVSNNPRTPQHISLLQIEPYIQQIVTPHTCPDTLPKPHRSLWEYIVAHETDIDPETTFVVGDDPWSDGAFAEDCGLECWLVDRLGRFSELYAQKPYRWVRSLSEILI